MQNCVIVNIQFAFCYVYPYMPPSPWDLCPNDMQCCMHCDSQALDIEPYYISLAHVVPAYGISYVMIMEHKPSAI